MADPVLQPNQNPFEAFSTLMLELLQKIKGKQEESLADLLDSVSMSFTAGRSNRSTPMPLQFGSDIGSFINTRYGEDWNFTFDEVDTGLRLTDMSRRTMGHNPRVCSRLEIEKVSIESSGINGGSEVILPLHADYRIAFAGGGTASYNQLEYHPYHRLATQIEQSYLMVYGYIVGSDGSLDSIGIDDAQSPIFLKMLLEHGTLQGQTAGSTVILVLAEWVFTRQKDDFDPFGAAYVARCYPLVSSWSNKPVDKFHCDIAVERPTYSDMSMGHDNGRLICSLYTDRNYEEAQTERDIGIPTWDKLFDHYQLEGNAVTPFKAVSDSGERTNSDDRVIHFTEDDQLQTQTTPVKKLARQGKFDNLHIAPAMMLDSGEPVYMAPVCHHDCLHLHWRWSSGYHTVQTLGWSPDWPNSGGSNRTPGSPMIPPNQTVTIESLPGATGILYRATAEKVDFGNREPSERWHIFFHHGFGYVVELRFFGSAIADFIGGPSVALLYHKLRYLTFDGSNEAPYVDESRFPSFEDM